MDIITILLNWIIVVNTFLPIINILEFYVPISLFFILLVLKLVPHTFSTTLKAWIFNRDIAELNDIDGTSKEILVKKNLGWLSTNTADYQLVQASITRGKDYNKHVLSRPFGLVIRTSVAACVESLKKLGYNNLADAIEKYEGDWFNTHQKEYEELIEEAQQQGKDVKNSVIVDEIKKQGQEALVKFTYFTNFTVPLGIVFNEWSAQVVNPENNKIIKDRQVLTAKEENQKQGMPASLAATYGFAVLLILIGIAVVYMVVSGNHQATQEVVNTVTTTVTMPTKLLPFT